MQQLSILCLTLLIISVSPVQAKMYKWVDENGQTHFGDKIPTQYLDKGHKELNEQGATVKKVDAAPTEEELQELKRQAKIKKEEEKRIKESKKRDRVLLDTYTTERDLIAARDARLDAVGSQLQLSESIIQDAERNLEQTKNQIAAIKAQGKEVPKNISDKITKDKKQLATYKKAAKGHQERKQKIMVQFESYIKRFRELKEDGKRIKEERKAGR
jgi:hypothetical protein